MEEGEEEEEDEEEKEEGKIITCKSCVIHNIILSFLYK